MNAKDKFVTIDREMYEKYVKVYDNYERNKARANVSGKLKHKIKKTEKQKQKLREQGLNEGEIQVILDNVEKALNLLQSLDTQTA